MITIFEDFVKYDLTRYYVAILSEFDLEPMNDELLRKANYYQGGLIGSVRAILEHMGLSPIPAHVVALGVASLDFNDHRWINTTASAWTAATITAKCIYCNRMLDQETLEELFEVYLEIAEALS